MFTTTSDCFKCKCCGELPPGGMDQRLVDVLNKIGLTDEEINCGYRCPSHNAEVGGVSNSQHLFGIAADCDASKFGVDELAQKAEECGADGIGKYPSSNFVHVDTRGYTARWDE